jgi:hypothetical protein
MAFRTYDITLTGVAQRVITVLGITEGGPDDLGFCQVIFAADPANAAVCYVGDDNGISATSHGFALDPTQATAKDRESLGPFDAGRLKLSNFWVLGTNNERLHIAGVPF